VRLIIPFDGNITAATRYPVPDESQFEDTATGKLIDFLPAEPAFDQIIAAMTEQYPELDHLKKFRLGAVWKKVGGMSDGRPRYAKLVKVTGLLKHFCPFDFVVQISADNCSLARLTYFQIEALIYHELKHSDIKFDSETGETKSATIGHDFEGFVDEAKRYGAWHPAAQRMKEAFQPTLFDEIEFAQAVGAYSQTH
jgi:hypothetical protein